MRRLLTILTLMMTVMTAVMAQRYEVDPLFDDSVKCNAAVWKDSVWATDHKAEGIYLRKGDIVDSCGVSSFWREVTFERDGKKYKIEKSHLIFSADNPEGMTNPLSPLQQRMHSPIGHFFASMTPVYIVIALLLLSFVLMLIVAYANVGALQRTAVIIISASILAVSLIEIAGYYYMNTDAFWWCSYSRYGFFGSLLRVVPFGLVVYCQLISIRWFERVLLYNEPEYSDKRISVKPAAIGMGACIPVMLVYFIVTSAFLKWEGPVANAVGVAIFFILLVGGIALTARHNIKSLGPKLGVPVTVFTVIYIIGCVIAAFAVIVVLIRIVLQVLLVIFAIAVCSMAFRKRRYRGSDGRIYEEV